MVKLTDVSGIGPVTAKLLAKHNIKTVEALASASLAELQKIPGFNGDIRARTVKKSAADCLQKAAKQMTASTKSSTQATVKKVASGTVKSSQVSAPVKVELTAGKKTKQDDKKKDKAKKKDKDKDKGKKKSGKNKGKAKKKS
ncbi:MAG: helix-hairpin-helix domain-containing protein [Nitrosomonas sp.]|nr:MAG: helix-hairpin-helix domain-containing protein [Nitrosomonas sp.]